MIKYIVTKESTIDQFLSEFKLSKANIYKLKVAGVYVNGELTRNTNLKKGDILEFSNLETSKEVKEYKANLKIVYEDDYLIVVEKEINTLVHSDGVSNNALTNILEYYYQNNKINKRALVVHRLDYKTSGLVMFAKDILSQSFLNYQFEEGVVKRNYIAIVDGLVKDLSGIISLKIGRDRHNSKKMVVIRNGKEAITKYKVIDKKNNKSKLSLELITGRTHQIRVSLNYLGHPIIGDDLYFKDGTRLMLHANSLEFVHPATNKKVYIESSKLKGDKTWDL